MHALVVYESMFGNTEKIAEAIADGLSHEMTVQTIEVGSAPTSFAGVDLVVVGGPTHAFGMSRPSTRHDAAAKTADTVVSRGIGLREWIASAHADGVATATFDTRADKPRLPGSAAHTARRRLRQRGSRPVTPSISFYVTDMTGPLVPGEEDRARGWGQQLALAMT